MDSGPYYLYTEYRTIFNEVEVIVGFIVPQASRVGPFMLVSWSIAGNNKFGYLGNPCYRHKSDVNYR